MKENLCKNQKGKRVLAGILSITLLFSSGHFPFSMCRQRPDRIIWGIRTPTGALPGIITALITVELQRTDMARMGTCIRHLRLRLGFQVRRQHCFSGRHCPWRPVSEICLPSTSVISRSMRKQRLMVSGSCHQR